jgi:hypothetical protein
MHVHTSYECHSIARAFELQLLCARHGAELRFRLMQETARSTGLESAQPMQDTRLAAADCLRNSPQAALPAQHLGDSKAKGQLSAARKIEKMSGTQGTDRLNKGCRCRPRVADTSILNSAQQRPSCQ